jgi:hypothetical protein
VPRGPSERLLTGRPGGPVQSPQVAAAAAVYPLQNGVSSRDCLDTLIQRSWLEGFKTLLAGAEVVRLLKCCIVTIDAMGCQRAIAEQIIDQGGD